jgi:hypothetical protein
MVSSGTAGNIWDGDMEHDLTWWLSTGVNQSVEGRIHELSSSRPMVIVEDQVHMFHYFWYYQGDNNRYHVVTEDWNLGTESGDEGVNYLEIGEPLVFITRNYQQRFRVNRGSTFVKILLPNH